MGRLRAARIAIAVVLCTAMVFVGGAGLRSHRRSLAAEFARARDLHGATYAGSDACGNCHPEHDATWRSTYHRTMTQDVTPSSGADVVAGDFSGVTYRYGDVEARMHRDAAGHFVMSFASLLQQGPVVDAVIVRAVGSRRYQQYLAEVNGSLWRLPMAYHIEERRWFHMNGAFLTPDPDDERKHDGDRAFEPGAPIPRFGGGAFDRHVTRWNDNCVFCHNVAPNPGRDPDSGAFRTTVAELGIACEACHGPGAEHTRINGDPVRRYSLHLTGVADPTIVNPSRLSPARAADLCGRCHGQRISDDISPVMAHGDPFIPGDSLALYSSPLWQDTSLRERPGVFAARFWNDGTPRLTAYEYQGLLQSPCTQRGTLTCTSCHGMHEGDPRGQLRPAAVADGACTSCHAELAPDAAKTRHARHDVTSVTVSCVSCHMPRVVYGVLDVHRSHRIEVPNPLRAIATGRPDACTLCHVDASRAWAVTAYARLWPAKPSGDSAKPLSHEYASVDPAQDSGGDDLAPNEAIFGGDPVMRAIAADAIGRAPWPVNALDAVKVQRWRARILIDAMANDPYPAVRHLAARALGRLAVVRDVGAAPKVSAFDATAPSHDRARAILDLRESLLLPGFVAPDSARIAALRSRAARAEIDIGE